MSIAGDTRQHPLLACARGMATLVKDVAGVEPAFMTVAEKKHALLAFTRLESQVVELKLRVLEVAADEGMRSPAAWLSHHALLDIKDGCRLQHLARSLGGLPVVAAALKAGEIDPTKAAVIVRAISELPGDVGDEIRAKAETVLVTDATQRTPRELRLLGRAIYATVAPEEAEEHERRALEDAEAHADAVTSLSTRERGDGTTDLKARIPDAAAARLQTYLEAYTSPRQPDQQAQAAENAKSDLPSKQRYEHRLGQAFVSFLEHANADQLPIHGGSATSIVITMDADTLAEDVEHWQQQQDTDGEPGDGTSAARPHPGPSTEPTDDAPAAQTPPRRRGKGFGWIGDVPLSAGAVRRLACNARIIPATPEVEPREPRERESRPSRARSRVSTRRDSVPAVVPEERGTRRLEGLDHRGDRWSSRASPASASRDHRRAQQVSTRRDFVPAARPPGATIGRAARAPRARVETTAGRSRSRLAETSSPRLDHRGPPLVEPCEPRERESRPPQGAAGLDSRRLRPRGGS